MDGFEVLDQLRKEPVASELPVIIVTAKDLTPEDRHHLAGSIRNIITKGVAIKEELLKSIGEVLSQLEERRITERLSKKPVILVVEDNEVAALQIRSALSESGYAVVVATGGTEALESVEHTVPDAIILDLMMPEIDGFQVLERIRSIERTARIPVLVLTAKELTAKERARLKHNNIQQLIRKGSVDREQLVESVRKLIKSDSPQSQPKYMPRTQKIFKAFKKILVVEDNPDNMITITAILDEMECEYITAKDGEQAVKVTKEALPSLILMDIQLPVLSGIDAAKQIKSDHELADIPIIALTAKAMKGDREIILSSGFDDYVSKPFNPEDIKKIVKKWMGKMKT